MSFFSQTFEQNQAADRERWRREQERIEAEHQRTQLELEQEENHSVEDWISSRNTATRMPDLVSSSYVGEMFPYEIPNRGEDRNKKQKAQNSAAASTSLNTQEMDGNLQSRPPQSKLGLLNPRSREAHRSVSRPVQLRPSLARRHGSLDSLIDLLDRDKRASWASSDSEDGCDLLTSITATFDQKLQILLNPKYKLTGSGRKSSRLESPRGEIDNRFSDLNRSRTPQNQSDGSHLSLNSAVILDNDDSFRNPSLHRSPNTRSDPKIGIASRFERVNEITRAASSSPVTVSHLDPASPRKTPLPDFKSFLGKNFQPKESSASPTSVVLTQPKKLDTAKGVFPRKERSISKSEKTERNSNILRLSRGDDNLDYKDGKIKEDDKSFRKNNRSQRRHTVGGTDDAEHTMALKAVNKRKATAWDQLRPLVPGAVVGGSGGHIGNRSIEAWILQERLKGSSPDLSPKSTFDK